jgi:hypothetical protein
MISTFKGRIRLLAKAYQVCSMFKENRISAPSSRLKYLGEFETITAKTTQPKSLGVSFEE